MSGAVLRQCRSVDHYSSQRRKFNSVRLLLLQALATFWAPSLRGKPIAGPKLDTVPAFCLHQDAAAGL